MEPLRHYLHFLASNSATDAITKTESQTADVLPILPV